MSPDDYSLVKNVRYRRDIDLITQSDIAAISDLITQSDIAARFDLSTQSDVAAFGARTEKGGAGEGAVGRGEAFKQKRCIE